jgi:hypothetical protein
VDYEPEEPAANAQYALLFPRPRGRPPGSTLLRPDAATLDKIWDIGLANGTQEECAVAVGVSLKTLQRFFDDHEIARNTFEDARTAGTGSLRQHAYRESMSGNTPVLLQMIKHRLGMNDKFVLSSASGEDDEPKKLQRIVIELVDAKDSAS